MKNTLKILGCIALCEMAGIIGSIFTVSQIPTWYQSLTKPTFSPPSFVFGPIWTTLYALMGISLFLVWKKREDGKTKTALKIFWLQLFLNVVWSIIFFGSHAIGLAFGDIILLWLSIVATIILFARISKPAALLFLPYLLWVSFAGFLNYSLFLLNK